MNITITEEFKKKWTKIISEEFNWQIINTIASNRDWAFSRKIFVAPLFPIQFIDNNLLKIKTINIKNKAYASICIEKNTQNSKFFPYSQQLEYIYFPKHLNNLNNLISTYKPRARNKVLNGLRKFTFKKIKSESEIIEYQTQLKHMFIEQHNKFKSPLPPFSLINRLLNAGLIEITLGLYNEEVKSYIVIAKDPNIYHVLWMIRDSQFYDNSLSISLWHHSINDALNSNTKIFSLGTSFNNSLSRFKKQFNPKVGILVNINISSHKKNEPIEYIKSYRNKYMIKLMKIILNLLNVLLYKDIYIKLSEQIWKRFV